MHRQIDNHSGSTGLQMADMRFMIQHAVSRRPASTPQNSQRFLAEIQMYGVFLSLATKDVTHE